MALRTRFEQWFEHPLPGIVFLVGLGLWTLATVWSIVGGVLSQVTTLTFALVVLLAILIGALGTLLIVIGSLWYGLLLALDFRAESQTNDSNR